MHSLPQAKHNIVLNVSQLKSRTKPIKLAENNKKDNLCLMGCEKYKRKMQRNTY